MSIIMSIIIINVNHWLIGRVTSVFPQTFRDWNDLPDSLISSAEMSVDSVFMADVIE